MVTPTPTWSGSETATAPPRMPFNTGDCIPETGMSISGNPTKPSQMYLKLGNHVDDVVEKNEILATVRRILSHKEYNSKLDNDIAVIQLQSPVNFTNFINAIRLPTKDFPTNNNTCVAIGWGRLSGIDHFSRNTNNDNSTQAVNLQQTIMPIIGYSRCDEQWPSLNIEKTGRICASSTSLNEKSSICQGDSGGPLFCQENVDKTKLFTLYGVTSLVDARSCTLKPGVFVRTYAYMKWITQVAQNINKYADQQHTKLYFASKYSCTVMPCKARKVTFRCHNFGAVVWASANAALGLLGAGADTQKPYRESFV
uniref:Peptidase S1 domain-containing protein n=1 Tax=Romanomermis culicivorax TaxID=13658 RepID=A0A915L2T4_ROMCU